MGSSPDESMGSVKRRKVRYLTDVAQSGDDRGFKRVTFVSAFEAYKRFSEADEEELKEIGELVRLSVNPRLRFLSDLSR